MCVIIIVLHYLTLLILTTLFACGGLSTAVNDAGDGPGSERRKTARTVTNLGGAMQMQVVHTSFLDVQLGAAWMQTPLQDEAVVGQNLVLDNPSAIGEMRSRRQHAGPQLSLNLNAHTNADFSIQPQLTAAYMPSVYARTTLGEHAVVNAANSELVLGEMKAAGRLSLGCAFRMQISKRWALELLPRVQFSMMQGQRAGKLLVFRLAIKRNR